MAGKKENKGIPEKKAVSQNDKLTVSVLNNALKHIDKRLKSGKDESGKEYSKTALKKLEDMKKKYSYQLGKTIKLYNKYSKQENTKRYLKGLSVNVLSVEKIYKLIGTKTRDKSALGNWSADHPGAIWKIVGSSLAVAGALSFFGENIADGLVNLFGPGGPLNEVFTQMFANMSGLQIAGMGLLAAGAACFLVGSLIKRHKKKSSQKAIVEYQTTQAMHEGTIKDNDTLKGATTAAKIDALASEASVDPDLMQHLYDVAGNPNTPPNIAKNAMAIYNKAKIYQQQNADRAIGTQLQTIVEQSAQPGGDKAEAMQRFAVYKKLEGLEKIIQEAKGIKPEDVTQEKIDAAKAAIPAETDPSYAAKKSAYEELKAKAAKYKAAKAAETEKSAITASDPTIDTTTDELDSYTFDGLSAEQVEDAGIEAILKTATESGLEGFKPTGDPKKNKALYEQLCAKYGIDKSVQNIAEIQLKLGGAEKAAE